MWRQTPIIFAFAFILAMPLGVEATADNIKAAEQARHQQEVARLADAHRLAVAAMVARDQAEAIQSTAQERDAAQAKAGELQQALDAATAERDKLKDQVAALQQIAVTAYQPTCSSCGGGGGIAIIAYNLAPAPWPNRMIGGQCTWYIANRRYIPWLGNAWQWFGQAQAYGWSTGQSPSMNAIEVAWLTGWGHVAWIEAVIDSNTWIVTEMNYIGPWVVDRRLVHRATEHLIGFIYKA